jgi:hypothetical protein
MAPIDVIISDKHSCSKIPPELSSVFWPNPQNFIASQMLMQEFCLWSAQ